MRMTSLSHGAGCACKLGPDALGTVLAGLSMPTHPDLVVGTETGDDALVWRRPDGSALVATCDFFMPIVDDARTWGRIAATNAASDVYAMGGRPLFALNLVGWPADLPLELLGEVLAGGLDAAADGGWVVAGGHTIDSPEPQYGQAVVGEVAPERLLTNAGAAAGQALVLTKALGTGVVATALKRSEDGAADPGGPLAVPYEAAVASMCTLNADAAAAALDAGAAAATDVTGFGLLGHLHKLALASGVTAVVDTAAVPVLPGVGNLVAEGYVSGGTRRNLDWVTPHLDTGGHDDATAALLADAQTSGGLLFACEPAAALDAVDRLRWAGHPAAVVGELVAGTAGAISLR
ncbi:MAG: selenide, water dikinase SelD [Microthrixaceae bacterium]